MRGCHDRARDTRVRNRVGLVTGVFGTGQVPTRGLQKPYSEQQGAKEGQPYSHWTEYDLKKGVLPGEEDFFCSKFSPEGWGGAAAFPCAGSKKTGRGGGEEGEEGEEG